MKTENNYILVNQFTVERPKLTKTNFKHGHDGGHFLSARLMCFTISLALLTGCKITSLLLVYRKVNSTQIIYSAKAHVLQRCISNTNPSKWSTNTPGKIYAIRDVKERPRYQRGRRERTLNFRKVVISKLLLICEKIRLHFAVFCSLFKIFIQCPPVRKTFFLIRKCTQQSNITVIVISFHLQLSSSFNYWIFNLIKKMTYQKLPKKCLHVWNLIPNFCSILITSNSF